MSDITGLEIMESEFMSLKSKQQMLCLYQNQVETLKLIKSYKFHQKVQYFCMGLLGTGYLILLNFIIR
jgi:hypothetical protein